MNLTPEIRSDLIAKARTFLSVGTPDAEVLDGLSKHLEGLGVLNYSEDAKSLIEAATAKIQHGATEPELTFFESIALPLAARGWKVAPCFPVTKQVHTRLVPEPLKMQSSDAEQIHQWGLAEPDANVCVYAEQSPGWFAVSR